jgi:hypothetical protein
MMMNRLEKNIHPLSGIRTHGLNIQAIKAYASERAATVPGTGCWRVIWKKQSLGLTLHVLKSRREDNLALVVT